MELCILCNFIEVGKFILMVKFCLENFVCILGRFDIVVEYVDIIFVFRNRGMLFCIILLLEFI